MDLSFLLINDDQRQSTSHQRKTHTYISGGFFLQLEIKKKKKKEQ